MKFSLLNRNDEDFQYVETEITKDILKLASIEVQTCKFKHNFKYKCSLHTKLLFLNTCFCIFENIRSALYNKA